MFDLLAEGQDPRQRWKFRLTPGTVSVLGRAAETDLPVPWDAFISRRHARLEVKDGAVDVARTALDGNPVYFDGQPVDHFVLTPGRHFVIGNTTFTLENPPQELPDSAVPIESVTFDRAELRKVRYRDADRRIEVLSNIPEVIWGARTEPELHQRVINLVLAGVPRAEAAAIVSLDSGDRAQLIHWDRRRETEGTFRPSGRLVVDALRRQRRTVLHLWKGRMRTTEDYTEADGFDWAWCTPVVTSTGAPWGLYVAGRMNAPLLPSDRVEGAADLQPDVKFIELLAEIVSTVQRLSRLEQQRSALKQFFSPQVFSALGEDWSTDVLKPRECDVTVMFCDLRGFSQKAEEAQGNLLGLLQRVSAALETMTHHILKYGGVTADFLGDACLGFWGWPFASEEAPVNACRAALGIRQVFDQIHRQKNHPLADFRMGIGIAHGRAVAGKIGTSEQVKITVFGSVVNLASRLEGMTRELRVPIVLDEATANIVRPRLPEAEGRLRRLARVLPYGMERPVSVSELLPPESEFSTLTSAHLQQYEAGVAAFIEGKWDEAFQLLHGMPAGDRAQDFLSQWIIRSNRIAPPDWDGIVRLPNK